MIPRRKRILLLDVNGQVIRTTADHLFFVPGQGWTPAAQLQVGALLHTHVGEDLPITAITDTSEEEIVYQSDAAEASFLFTGWWPAGTLIETEHGPKSIEDIKPGNRLMVGNPLDPERN
jgi:hypothetical protein